VPGTDGTRRIVLWTHFDREAILADFFATMDAPALVWTAAATARP
jgi:hypothetical protein